MRTSTTKRKAIADAVELLKEESPNAPGNIAGVQLIPIEKVRAFKDHPLIVLKHTEQHSLISLYAGYYVSIVLSVCSCCAMLLIYVLKLSTVCSQTDLESDYVKRF